MINILKISKLTFPLLLAMAAISAWPALAQEPSNALWNLYTEKGADAIPILYDKIINGSPKEKETTLTLFQSHKLAALIPAVIEAINDPTPLPLNGDTGWGFVAHQAATALGVVAQSLDRISPKVRGRDSYSFYNDMYKGGETLQTSGRLLQVQSNWKTWWENYKEKVEPGAR